MKKTLTIIAIITLSMVSSAQAEETPSGGRYVKFNLGLNILNDATLSEDGFAVETSFDSGLAMSSALGLKFTGGRAEVELAYRQNDIDSFSALGTTLTATGDVSSKSVMLNLYHDFTNTENVNPFLGAGLGLTKVEISNAAVVGIALLGDADDTVFTWQIMAGLGFEMGKDTLLDISWRYFNAVDPNFEGTDAEYKAHTLMAGLRVKF